MNIKEAEKLTGISTKAIRYYEEAGLLTVHRDNRTGYRIFHEEDIKVLKEIKLYRNIGIPIQMIKDILQKATTPANGLSMQLQELDGQIQSLQMKKDLLHSLLSNEKLLNNSSELIVDFEDIQYYDTPSLRNKLQQLELKCIILASMGASPQVNEILQELLPEVNFPMEQKTMGRVKIEEIEKAQLHILMSLNNNGYRNIL